MAILSIVVDCVGFNPCCPPGGDCYSTYGPDLEVTISGVSLCGCFTAGVFADPPSVRYYTPVAMTGVNGVFTLTNLGGPGTDLWGLGVIGTLTLQQTGFGGGDLPAAECPGEPIGDPFDVDVDLEVRCHPEDGFKLFAAASITLQPGIGGVAVLLFSSGVVFFELSDVVPNAVDCTDLDMNGYYLDVAGNGQLTVEIP